MTTIEPIMNRKFRVQRTVTAFQWRPGMWHPRIHFLDDQPYVLGTTPNRLFLRPGDWVVIDEVYQTADVVDPSYFPHMYAAVEIVPMKSLRAGMTEREWKRLQKMEIPGDEAAAKAR
jgi:hypothetical protein